MSYSMQAIRWCCLVKCLFWINHHGSRIKPERTCANAWVPTFNLFKQVWKLCRPGPSTVKVGKLLTYKIDGSQKFSWRGLMSKPYHEFCESIMTAPYLRTLAWIHFLMYFESLCIFRIVLQTHRRYISIVRILIIYLCLWEIEPSINALYTLS